jgi:hypothetical protein
VVRLSHATDARSAPRSLRGGIPRTIFGSGGAAKFYDQIAWFVDRARGPMLGLEWLSSGSFDFVPLLQGSLTKTALSWKLSDRYPLWAELSVR